MLALYFCISSVRSNIRIYSNATHPRIFKFEYIRVMGHPRIFERSSIFKYLSEYKYLVATMVDLHLIDSSLGYRHTINNNVSYLRISSSTARFVSTGISTTKLFIGLCTIVENTYVPLAKLQCRRACTCSIPKDSTRARNAF